MKVFYVKGTNPWLKGVYSTLNKAKEVIVADYNSMEYETDEGNPVVVEFYENVDHWEAQYPSGDDATITPIELDAPMKDY